MKEIAIAALIIMFIGFCTISYLIAACLRLLERISVSIDIVRADSLRTFSTMRSKYRGNKK
jgi:hypothetical protein